MRSGFHFRARASSTISLGAAEGLHDWPWGFITKVALVASAEGIVAAGFAGNAAGAPLGDNGARTRFGRMFSPVCAVAPGAVQIRIVKEEAIPTARSARTTLPRTHRLKVILLSDSIS